MQKKSRAYEAGESLADMPIKKTKMSHKKCTPAEFGAMVKEAASLQEMIQNVAPTPVSTYTPYGLGGAAAGSVVGGLLSPKGQLLRGMLRGGLMGGTTGLGAAAGQNFIFNTDNRDGVEYTPLGRALMPGLGGLAGLLTGAMANRVSDEFDTADGSAVKKKKNRKQTKSAQQPAARNMLDMIKTQSARDFGAYVKQSFNIQEYLPQSSLGAAGLGAGIGALGGMLIPGEDEEGNGEHRYDSAIRRALLGAGVGGLAGAGAYYLPQLMGGGSTQQAAPQSLATQSGQQSTVSPTGAAAATSQNRYGSLVPPAATASSPAAGASLDPATQNRIVQGLQGVGSGLDAAAAFTNPGLLLGHAGASGLNALQQYGASLGKKIKARPAPTKPFYSPDPAMREVMQRPVAGFKPNKQRRPFD